MPAAQLPYRYGHGARVLHILPPPGPGDRPTLRRDNLVRPLCQNDEWYRAYGPFEPDAQGRTTCKRCLALWAKALGTALPAKPKVAKGPVTRDVQRQRLYNSDDAVKVGHRFSSEATALAYVKGLFDQTWAHQRGWGRVRLGVRFGTGRGAYSYNGRGFVTLGYGQRHERTLLHEVAHQIVYQAYGGITIQAHGPLFARVFLALVQHKLGVAQAQVLLAGYRKERVKVASAALLERPSARPTDWRKKIHEGRVPA